MWFGYEPVTKFSIIKIKNVTPLVHHKPPRSPVEEQVPIVQLILIITSSYFRLQKITSLTRRSPTTQAEFATPQAIWDLLSLQSRGINIHPRHLASAYLWYFADFCLVIKDERSRCPSLNPAVLENLLRTIVRKRNEVFFLYSDMAKIVYQTSQWS